MGGGGGASRRAQAGPCGSAACSVLGVSYADPGVVVVAAAARAWWVPVGRAAHRSSAAAKSPTPTAPAAVPRPGFGRVRGWNVQVGRIIDRIGDRSPALAPPARGSPAPPNYTEPRRMQRPPARQPDGLRPPGAARATGWFRRTYPMPQPPSEAATSPVPCGPRRPAASCIPDSRWLR